MNSKQVILNDDTKDVALEMGESILDEFFVNNNLVDNIPILNSIKALLKTYNLVKNRILLKKITNFYSALNDTTLEEREDFIKKQIDNKGV